MSVQIALSECWAVLNASTPSQLQDDVRTIVHTLLQTTDTTKWILFVPMLPTSELTAKCDALKKVFPNLTFVLNTSKPIYEISYNL